MYIYSSYNFSCCVLLLRRYFTFLSGQTTAAAATGSQGGRRHWTELRKWCSLTIPPFGNQGWLVKCWLKHQQNGI